VVILPLAVAVIAAVTPLPEGRTRTGVGAASRDG